MRPRRQRAGGPAVTGEPNNPDRRRFNVNLDTSLLAGAFVAAALLRVIAFFQLRDVPNVTSDGIFYQGIAQKIVDGSFLREAKAFDFSPLYVFFLATVFKVAGISVNAVRAVQLLIGIASCALIFLIARRQFNRTAALVSLWLAALYVPFIHFETQLLSVTLALFLMLLSLHLLLLANERARTLWLVPAGLSLGLASLGSPTLLVLAGPAALWLGFLRDREPERRRFPFVSAQGAGQIGVYLFSVVLGVLPATVWNYRATGQLVLISSQGGVNFYIGNNADAPGYFVVPKGMEDSLTGINVTGAKRIAEAETQRPMTAREVSSHWFGKGTRFILDEPLAAARLFLRKCFFFANRYELPLDLDQEAFKQYFPLLRWPLVSFGVISLLGWLGMAIGLRQFRSHALLILMLGAYTLSVVVFFVTDRYRMPAVPLLILWSGFTAGWIRDKHRQKQVVAPLVAGLAGIAGAVLIVFAPTGLQGSPASLAFNMAIGYQQQNDLPRARVEFQRCVDHDRDWLEARYRLAVVDHQLGDAARALENADIVIAHAPHNADAHELRAQILLEKGLPLTAKRELETVLSLTPGNAAATARLREADQAIRASAAQPAGPRLEALDREGWRMMDAKQYPPAIATLAELLASERVDPPLREKTLAALGFSYASQGRLDLAVSALEEAHALNAQNALVHKNLALLYLKMGKVDKARPHVEAFTKLSPGDPFVAELQSALAQKTRR